MQEKKTAGGGRSTSPKSTSPARAKPAAATSKSPASPARARKPARRATIARKQSAGQRIRQGLKAVYTAIKDPAFWRRTIQKLPPWTGEVAAILLIVWGVVMLTALFNTTSEAMLSVTLSKILRQGFGHGAYVVALGVFAIGIIALLPKFGITIRFSWVRITAIEVVFGSLTALLHLFANDPEARALARAGGGGGYLGWALSQIPASLGHSASILIFSVLFGTGLILGSGLRWRHLAGGVAWINARLQRSINHLDSLSFEPVSPPTPEPDDDSAGSPTPKIPRRSTPAPDDSPAPRQPYGRPSVVPREVDSEDDPAGALSAQSGAAAASVLSPAESTPAPLNLASSEPVMLSPPRHVRPRRPQPAISRAKKKELVDETRRTLGGANGRSLVAPGEPGERSSIVPRDFLPEARAVPAAPRARVHRKEEARVDRYFTVDDFREVKKISKRDPGLPALDLLNDVELNKPTEEEINTNARIIKNTLLDFDVEVEVIDVKVGPTVTQYAVSPYTEMVNDEGETVLNRVRVSQIANLNGDLALALSAKRLRVQAPVPGHSYVGVEVPNRQPSTVALRPVLETENFYRYRNRPLALPLGRDVSGEPFVADLQTMPHLLIAGTTGSGKSIMLAAMTVALVMNNPPDRVKLILLDPKMVELSRFNGLPHLLGQVETELDRIIEVLRWITREMDLRYKLLEKEAARNLEIYNKSLGRRRQAEQLPYIVVIIDEIGDLMMQRPDETERALTRLAQMARAVGIHLMVATQRPSVDVITGLIKANFPARISFAVASGVDSRVILDSSGAETLMGRGDMLFLAPDAAGPQRIQGCYISDDEVNAVVAYWREWHEQEIEAGRIEPVAVAPWERGLTRREVLSETDPMLEDAIALVIAEREASASLIQRRLGLGYPRAARLMDLMQELGVVGGARPGGRSREVLVKPGADPFKKLMDKRLKAKE